MKKESIYVSELSASKHLFKTYHFSRRNTNKRKTRIGIILQGSGTYIYLNKRLNVSVGDVVYIPENVYCFSEWYGSPDIEVLYVSCFIHRAHPKYEPQKIFCDDSTKSMLFQISELVNSGSVEELEAYSLFYKVLQHIFPQMVQSDISIDRTLQKAIEYITNNWNKHIGVADVASSCFISESSLYHLFQKGLGQTPIQFLNSIRINMAIEFLENSNYSVAEISRLVCFNSENHFRKVFSDHTGSTPLKFRKGLSVAPK